MKPAEVMVPLTKRKSPHYGKRMNIDKLLVVILGKDEQQLSPKVRDLNS